MKYIIISYTIGVLIFNWLVMAKDKHWWPYQPIISVPYLYIPAEGGCENREDIPFIPLETTRKMEKEVAF